MKKVSKSQFRSQELSVPTEEIINTEGSMKSRRSIKEMFSVFS